MSPSTIQIDKTSSESGLLPWHFDQWQILQTHRRTNTLPHALLLSGLSGLGKNRFAEVLTQSLLCNSPQHDGQACHTCRSCLLYQAGTHPDYLQLHPREDDKPIVVEQIRELNAHLALKSQYAGHKLVIISPAEQMNTAAANSLLKTLEEPSAQSLLMLVTSQPAALLPTVRSRCQRIKFASPPESVALNWLKASPASPQNTAHLLMLAGGAPLKALSMGASDNLSRRMAAFDGFEKLVEKKIDPLTLAAIWLQGDVAESLAWLLSYTMDMVRLQSASNPPYLSNPDLQQRLRLIAQRYSPQLIHAHLDCVTQAIKLLNRQVNIQLLLEDILISWRHTSRNDYRKSG